MTMPRLSLLRGITPSRALVRALNMALVIACLGLIVWAVTVVLQRPCRVQDLQLTEVGTPCPTLLEDLAPLAIALGICIIILGVEIVDRGASVAEFVIVAAILATGILALAGIDTAFRLNYLLLAWASPHFYHLHIRLTGGVSSKTARRMLHAFRTLAVLGSIPVVLWSRETLQAMAWYGAWRGVVRLTIPLAMVAAVILAVRYAHRERSDAGRRPVRLITFGSLAAMLPMVLLSLVPETLGIPVMPYELTFVGLLVSPLLYAYAMLPYRMTKLDAFLRRAAVYYLLGTLLATSFLVGAAFVHARSAYLAEHWPVLGTLVGAVTLTIMPPLERRLTRLTDWVWFGRSASYSGVVGHLAESLSTTLDRATLERLLVRDLATAMNLSWSTLYLRGQDETLMLVASYGTAPRLPEHLPADGALVRALESQAAPESHEDLCASLLSLRPRAAEREVLAVDAIALWLPLVSSGVLHGILLLGPKTGDDFYTPQDYDILTTLAHQSGIAAHNVHLVDQVSAGRQELAKAHRQLLAAGEQERRRLAQELHDGAVQQLIGISYQLAAHHRRVSANHSDGDTTRAELLETMEVTRQEVLAVATELRSVIGELRPAGLEELGLAAALYGYVSRLSREFGDDAPEIAIDLDDGTLPIPLPVALCLFRVAQEGLRNAIKHANASHVTLRLRSEGGQVRLTVRDDGSGFEVPQRLSELAAHDHYGLVTITERIAQVGGELAIHSEPGVGSEITVQITASQEEEDAERTDQGSPRR